MARFRRPEGGVARIVVGALLLAILPATGRDRLRAQQDERPDVARALELENAGKLKASILSIWLSCPNTFFLIQVIWLQTRKFQQTIPVSHWTSFRN